MATFNYQGYDIYYEEHGTGTPLLFINGIFMSTGSWMPLMDSLKENNRIILLDLFDQGRSSRRTEDYTQKVQVDLVAAFIDYLKLDKVNVLGISYGGEIALQLAVGYPDKIDKLILSNTCSNTTPWLRDIGKSWEYSYESYDGHQFFKTCIPIVYSPKFYEKNYEWISAREDMFVELFTPDIYDAFGRLTRSAETYDVREDLANIKHETLVISSEHDYVTPPFQQRELAEAIPNAGYITIEDAGHSVMYEKPREFISAVLGFINSKTNIQVIK